MRGPRETQREQLGLRPKSVFGHDVDRHEAHKAFTESMVAELGARCDLTHRCSASLHWEACLSRSD